MKHELINLGKLKRAAVLTFQNCLRLHFDSIVLHSSGSSPSAFTLSVLALEEFGKYMMLEDFVWHSETERRSDAQGEQDALNAIYQHSIKQSVYANSFCREIAASKLFADLHSGKIERLKQKATYVGLPKPDHRVDVHGRICSPFRITRRMAAEQIGHLSDSLLLFCAGFLKGITAVDVKQLEEHLSHDLINKLRAAWPTMQPSVLRRFERLMSFPDADLN